MKVALAFPGCHRRGGVERVLVECANFLHKQGHEVYVVASECDASVLYPKIQTCLVNSPHRWSLQRLPVFVRKSTLATQQILPLRDIVGGFGVVSPPHSIVWVQSVHRAWLEISTQHRSIKGRLKQKLNLTHKVILAMEQDYFGGRKYRKLIALSEQVKIDLMRFYQVPEQDIVIIPNGFAPAEFNPQRVTSQRKMMRARLGYEVSDRVIIFVANELERKGFGPLLKAVALLNDPSLRVLVVGRVKPNAYLLEMKRLGLAERIQFVGSSNDVAIYYAAADLFALPTQYEAWGLVIVEAMACGLPVLTSRLAGASIAVQEGVNGELLEDPYDTTEIADKLRSLLTRQYATAEDIATSVAEYAWPCVLQQYEKVLMECSQTAAVQQCPNVPSSGITS